MPSILNALELDYEGQKYVFEVSQHIGDNIVRTISMGTTEGLVRGLKVIDTGQPIMVPVGTGDEKNAAGALRIKAAGLPHRPGEYPRHGVVGCVLVVHGIQAVRHDHVRRVQLDQAPRKPAQHLQTPVVLADPGQDDENRAVFRDQRLAYDQIAGFGGELPVDAVCRVAGAVRAQIMLLGKTAAVFRLQNGGGRERGFKIDGCRGLDGLRHDGAQRLGKAPAADRKQPEEVPALIAEQGTLQLPAAGRGEGDLTAAVFQISENIVLPGPVAGIAVADFQMDRHRVHRQDPGIGKIDSQVRLSAAHDALRCKKRDLQAHHRGQRDQQHHEREQDRRCKQIRPEPADIAGTEKPGPGDQQQIEQNSKDRHYRIRGTSTAAKTSARAALLDAASGISCDQMSRCSMQSKKTKRISFGRT